MPRDVLHLAAGRRPARRGARQGRACRGRRLHRLERDGLGRSSARSPTGASAIVPFIAETGGINAMIADSTRAARAGGARCACAPPSTAQASAARPRACSSCRRTARRARSTCWSAPSRRSISAIRSTMRPTSAPSSTRKRRIALDGHKIRMQREARELVDLTLPEHCRAGSYVTPAVYEIDRGDRTRARGVRAHPARRALSSAVISTRSIAAINATGYGLTLGLHSRIETVADYVAEHARVGNLYVNRNQIGAVVGAQPFGGEGLSGTGPKAGGPKACRLCAGARALDRHHGDRRQPPASYRRGHRKLSRSDSSGAILRSALLPAILEGTSALGCRR